MTSEVIAPPARPSHLVAGRRGSRGAVTTKVGANRMDRRNFVRAAAGAAATVVAAGGTLGWVGRGMSVMPASGGPDVIDAKAFHGMRRFAPTAFGRIAYRSEEHTSELQSPCNLV